MSDIRDGAGEDGFDLSAAGLRSDWAELAGSIEVLASKLEQALPGSARVQRSGGGLLGRGEKHVRRVIVELDGSASVTYQLDVDGPHVSGFRERKVGGIAIKREALSTERWLGALTEDLRVEAARSAEARSALGRLLG